MYKLKNYFFLRNKTGATNIVSELTDRKKKSSQSINMNYQEQKNENKLNRHQTYPLKHLKF